MKQKTYKELTYIDDNDYKIITEYNHLDQIIKEIYCNPNETIYGVRVFDPQTKSLLKTMIFFPEEIISEHPQTIYEYNSENQKTKSTFYNPDGSIRYIRIYDSQTNKITKSAFYHPDGSLRYINLHDPQSEKRITSIWYDFNEKINYIYEYEPTNGISTKYTSYNPDGSVLKTINFPINKPSTNLDEIPTPKNPFSHHLKK
ncbi:DUF2963 domain-containing protein [Candidatus Phytoplasma pruni]|uniref:DUF2963 domain-containing protein n=1 Tax=Candidatus Phytoplasma pruni TaxID=479893 RepID=A0A851HD30_9MOLU|nr:DUF2963 domain-containing protein [Candidatus Phytoplasma pruni]NWN45888.1 DUF2963 domain-containing protein [Candidatus Phytoplasma pruni]